jgi:hypothetical protein
MAAVATVSKEEEEFLWETEVMITKFTVLNLHTRMIVYAIGGD